jgi:hypothetical protein
MAFVEEMDARLAQIPHDADIEPTVDVRELDALTPRG